MTETLNIYNSSGALIGQKEKAEVHANSDWHRAFHLWIYFPKNNSIYQIMQIRSTSKQVYPGLIDCAAAGHFRDNEILSDGVREAKEELGVCIDFSQLKFLGVRKSTTKNNKEFQYIFLLEKEIDFNEISFDSKEIDAVLKVDNSHLKDLLSGNIDKLVCSGITIEKGEKVIKEFSLNKDRFIPTSDSYYEKIAFSISKKGEASGINFFSNILNLSDGLELNNSNNISEYIKAKSYSDLNKEFQTIFSNSISEKLFFKAIIQFTHQCDSFVDYLFHSIEKEIEPVIKKIYCLGWLKSEESINALKMLTQSKLSYIRSIAVFVLGEICDLKSLCFLGEKISDSDNFVSRSACFSLGWNQGKVRLSILENYLAQVSIDKKIFVEKAIRMFNG